jgi:hypothetical protein
MIRTDWLKYRNDTPYAYNGLYNGGYGWNTWDAVRELYDRGDLTFKAAETIEKIDKLEKSVYNKNVKNTLPKAAC